MARPGSSRNPTGRPRKVAGRGPAADPLVEDDALPPVPTPREDDTTQESDGPETVAGASSSTTAARAEEKRPASRLTALLVAVCAVLALAGIAEIVYLAHDPTPTVSAKRPVVTGELDSRTAVQAAAQDTQEILSTTYQDYDGQVAKATDRMTDTFAAQYKQTADGIKDQFVANKTKLQVKAVAQGVVQASPQQVQALLFLNQYVEKVQDGQPRTSFAQYRALVTMVHTDKGWLVSNIETQ